MFTDISRVSRIVIPQTFVYIGRNVEQLIPPSPKLGGASQQNADSDIDIVYATYILHNNTILQLCFYTLSDKILERMAYQLL